MCLLLMYLESAAGWQATGCAASARFAHISGGGISRVTAILSLRLGDGDKCSHVCYPPEGSLRHLLSEEDAHEETGRPLRWPGHTVTHGLF